MTPDSPENPPALELPPRRAGIQAAWGLHLGWLLVAASAVLSRQVPRLDAKQAGVLVLVGLALPIWAGLERGCKTPGRGLRAATGLGAALLLGLARTPRLTPYLGISAESPYAHLPISLGTAGALLAFICWLVYCASGGEAGHGRAPFRRVVGLSLALVLLLTALTYLIFGSFYHLTATDLGSLEVAIRALQMAALLIPVLGATGGPLIRRAPAYYFGVALLVAAALALAGHGGGMPA
jgi:hypothetical protein